jgi:DNA polymerase-3 subunit chi
MNETPCEVWFYHLERTGVDQTLPELLERTLARGWRALVICADSARVEALDTWLWTYREESFLPHGTTHEPVPERQPVLLTEAPGNLNQAKVVFALGADPGDLGGYERCVVLFDGRDHEALGQARGLWKRYKAKGHGVTYWQQGERGWEKRA